MMRRGHQQMRGFHKNSRKTKSSWRSETAHIEEWRESIGLENSEKGQKWRRGRCTPENLWELAHRARHGRRQEWDLCQSRGDYLNVCFITVNPYHQITSLQPSVTWLRFLPGKLNGLRKQTCEDPREQPAPAENPRAKLSYWGTPTHTELPNGISVSYFSIYESTQPKITHPCKESLHHNETEGNRERRPLEEMEITEELWKNSNKRAQPLINVHRDSTKREGQEKRFLEMKTF